MPRRAATPRTGSVRRMLEGYEIEAELGAGGMGTVYRARVSGTEQRVALKVLREELASVESARARFIREVHAMCRVKSRYFVRVLDILMDHEPPYFVMELLDGEDLAARMKSGPLELEEAISLAVELAEAIRELHSLGIVHRDLKPGNVFLVESDPLTRVKVLDFGIATVADDLFTSTMSGVIGTVSYMAPEQLMRPEDASKASDVFAFGVVLFEMLTGVHPFRMRDLVLPMAILKEPPRSAAELVPDLPLGILSILSATLVKRPEARPTIGDVEAWLKRELSLLDDDFDFAETQEIASAPSPSFSSSVRPAAASISDDGTSTYVDEDGETQGKAR